MDPLIIVIIGSAVERIFAFIIGGACIYWGWKLFYIEANAAHSEMTVNMLHFRASLKRVGPGVLFAAFGCAVVTASFFYPMHLQYAASPPVAVAGPGPSFSSQADNPIAGSPIPGQIVGNYTGVAGPDPGLQSKMLAQAVALNQVLQIIQQRSNNDPGVLSARINDLANEQTVFQGLRDSIVGDALGTDMPKLWAADGPKYLEDPNAFGKLNPETAELAALAPWYSTQPLPVRCSNSFLV